jgi:hypothetical protein
VFASTDAATELWAEFGAAEYPAGAANADSGDNIAKTNASETILVNKYFRIILYNLPLK